jgi:two-component system OmpR family sensor kinase
LILGVICLATIGLVVADVVTYSSLSSFLIDRTDSSLDAAHVGVENALLGPPGGGGDGGDGFGPGGGPLVGAARGDWVELRTLKGRVLVSNGISQFGGESDLSPPKLPAAITLPAARIHGDRVSYFTVGAKDGGGRYRVRASIDPRTPSYVLMLAQPLGSVDSTLNRLFWIELLVTASVLAAMALLGLWVVRLSLRPLAAIGQTASKIAAGDLSQRVDRAENRTEVGRLGLALNSMLTQIESAFRAREESEKRLRASEAKLRRFVADASHELRTPLAAVRAYAELFTRGAAERPADLERSMKGIRRESERMSLLVEDLLLLAHLDEGRPLEREPVELDALVAEAVETAHAVEPDRPIATELEPVTVMGDRVRLRQIVDNLLANVRSHTPPETPVRVSVARRDGAAEVAVADEGPGLTEEQAAHVFERFYRADASRSRTSGGIGLGLSIVAAVAEAHGGRVTAESGPGRGATFRIELPLARGAVPEPA